MLQEQRKQLWAVVGVSQSFMEAEYLPVVTAINYPIQANVKQLMIMPPGVQAKYVSVWAVSKAF